MKFIKINFGRFTPVIKNASYLSVFEIMRMVMPFIALPYLISTVGKDNYGTVVFVQSIIACFTLIINFGLDTSAVKDVAVHRDQKEQLDKIVSSVIIIKSLFLIISFLLLVGILLVVPKLGAISQIFYFAFIACFADIFIPVWYFQGKEEMKILTIIRFFSIAFYTVSIFIFVRVETDYPYIALLQSISLVLSSAVSCYFVFGKDKIHFSIPQTAFMTKMLKESSPFFLSRVSLAINGYMAKIMSYFFLSGAAVASFDVAQKIIAGGMMPMQMFNQALYPNISKSQDKQMLHRGFRIIACITVCITIIILFVSDFGIRLLSGGEIQEAGLLRILCIYLFLAGFSVFMGTSTLVAFGYQKPFNMSVIWSTVVLIICYSLMIITGNSSIYLYALTLVAAECMVFGYRFYYCHKYGLLSLRNIFE